VKHREEKKLKMFLKELTKMINKIKLIKFQMTKLLMISLQEMKYFLFKFRINLRDSVKWTNKDMKFKKINTRTFNMTSKMQKKKEKSIID
jgi:hypothetical protein